MEGLNENKVAMVSRLIQEFLESDDEPEELTLLKELPLWLSSSSDEDDKEPMFEIIFMKRKNMKQMARMQNYAEIIVPGYTASEFKSHFRLLPTTFEFILGRIGPTISSTNTASGRKPIDAAKQLLLTLWTYATRDSYKSICCRFNVGSATALRTVRRVSRALCSLTSQFIQWPTGEKALQIMHDFERHSGFPKIIGAIDGTHININAPPEDHQQKVINSVHIQAVCTHDLLFTSVHAEHTSDTSSHDASIFRHSQLQDFINDPDAFFPEQSHLVGHADYGIHPNLMVPFKNNENLTKQQNNYNSSLSSATISIERALGLWKGRWRSILDNLQIVNVEKINEYLIATMVVHNICVLKKDMIPVEPMVRVAQRGRLILNGEEHGEAKRMHIMNNLPNKLI